MYPNYNIDHNGIIYQIEKQPFVYDEKYVSIYNERDSRSMSMLRYEHIVDILKIKPSSILDIGYGNGSFLDYCQSQSINACGYDISGVRVPDQCHKIEKLEKCDKNNYEIITFFDSLEHFPDIYTAINNLPSHSFVVISLPWCKRLNNITDEWFESWTHRKPNEHLWHFSDESLIKFMAKNGYCSISISNIEDKIRKSNVNNPNILTGIFKKIHLGTL